MIPRFPYADEIHEEFTDDEERVINDGIQHKKDGYYHDENPWNEGTREHKLWHQGWCDQDMTEISNA